MRATAPVALILLLLAAGIPTAAADHYDSPMTGRDARLHAGTTFEDDGAVVHAPGHALNGVANRVVEPGREPGDSGLFLDHYIEVRDAEQYAAIYGSEGGNRMLPGMQAHRARYGTWNDLNQNGVIDDNHDNVCKTASPACARDEFRWRGAATGEATPMIGWSIPSNTPWGTALEARYCWFCWEGATYDVAEWPASADPGQAYGPDDFAHNAFGWYAPLFGAYHNEAASNPQGAFKDLTNPDVYTHQVYSAGNGWEHPYTDDGVLVTMHVVVGANLRRDLSGAWNLDDPAALVDVDRYESVSPEVEGLWVSALRTARSEYHSVVDATLTPLVVAYAEGAGVLDPVNAITDDLYEEHVGPYTDPNGGAIDRAMDMGNNEAYLTAFNALYSPVIREPNTFEDRYPYATFDGVADRDAAGNDYSAYLGTWLLYGDVYARVGIGMIANADLGPYGSTGVSGELADVTPLLVEDFRTQPGWEYLDPYGAAGADDQRSAMPKMHFGATAIAWKDANADGWVGNKCNDTTHPADDCDVYNNGAYTTPHMAGGGEAAGLCSLTTLSGGTFTVQPVNGDWPPALVLRWYDRPTRNAWTLEDEYTTYVPQGRDVVTLRWDPAWNLCKGSGATSRSLDEIWFPAGTGGVALRVEATVTLLGEYVTPEGVTIAPGESFTDVDYHVAGL